MRCTQLSKQCVIEQTTSDREIEIARSGKLIFRSWLFTEFYVITTEKTKLENQTKVFLNLPF